MRTHTEKGIPIIPDCVLDKMADSMKKDIINVFQSSGNFNESLQKSFEQKTNEELIFWQRVESDNPNLARFIVSEMFTMKHLYGDEASLLMKTIIYQILDLIEKSEEQYMKG
jgi:hypothetical protein